MDIRNEIFKGKYLYTFPHVAWKLPSVMKNADPYHPSTSIPPNSSVIFGMAVATIVWVRIVSISYNIRLRMLVDHAYHIERDLAIKIMSVLKFPSQVAMNG